jgi:hypothetical protein
VELMVDQAVRLSQQQAREIARAILAPETDPTTLDMTLPASADRATYPMAFDALGQSVVGGVTMSAIEAIVNAAQEVEIGTMPVGTEGAPGLPFTGDSDTGIYRSAANQLGFSLAGVNAFLLSSTSLDFLPATGAASLGHGGGISRRRAAWSSAATGGRSPRVEF